MVATLADPIAAAPPWWSEARCRAHQPYPSRLAAARAAALHPLTFLRCPKCDEGRVPQPFRCHTEAHWHWGHGLPHEEEDDVVQATTLAAGSSAPLMAGDTWVAVSARGHGQPVTIRTVTPLNVQFRATGRGADSSKTYSLPVDVFRLRYAPLKLAAERQKQLARAEASGLTAPAVVVRPVEVPESAPAAEPVEAPSPPAPPAAAEAPVRHGGRPAKLTGEKAREIYLLVREGSHPNEVAETYGVHFSTIYDIVKGRTFAWATEPLRTEDDARRAVVASSPAAPSARERGASKLDADKARAIYGRLRAGEADSLLAHEFGVDKSMVRKIGAGERWAGATAALRAEQSPQEEPPVQITTPPTVIDTKPDALDLARRVLAEQRATAAPTLLADMADALETLVEYAGRPLPRFLRLDLDEVRALVAKARGAA